MPAMQAAIVTAPARPGKGARSGVPLSMASGSVRFHRVFRLRDLSLGGGSTRQQITSAFERQFDQLGCVEAWDLVRSSCSLPFPSASPFRLAPCGTSVTSRKTCRTRAAGLCSLWRLDSLSHRRRYLGAEVSLLMVLHDYQGLSLEWRKTLVPLKTAAMIDRAIGRSRRGFQCTRKATLLQP